MGRVVVRRSHALLRVEQGLEDLARTLDLVDRCVTLDEEVGNVRRHVDAARLQALEELRDEVHATERDERVDHGLVDDGIGHRRRPVLAHSRVSGDGVEDGDRLVEVLLYAPPGIDQRSPVSALDGDGGIGKEVLEDPVHSVDVDGLNGTVSVNEELNVNLLVITS